MSKRNAAPSQPPPRPLVKQHSWSPDADREEAWLRKKGKKPSGRLGRSKSVTDEDLEELKGCIELGFGFEPDSPDLDPRLSETLPALGLYCAVNKQYSSRLSRTSSLSSIASEGENSNSSTTIVDQGDDPETMKLRLKQWAQVVACSVRQFSGEPN
ncbi:unnamed protein product [Arabidopsis lyrata]|uniref:DUF1685 family protein n=1 Tax=Arabidopsis lyrata subsp. lyrata TaxID=81972 RepID=D7MFS9_ARALL|nr:uncharacterized protein LOC9303212 [Arabidopsis lyrata subsp. lyrata]EFH43399.1 hypothetical protein ARALYDRAFT_913003 [Arabidopsis lyrata subsp. lyrata]CAH8274406.1 unnamed protein product [Arabidopsis lyrata]|eukprot:XP_002867140.1 uncharacterized protein LOC9303212 [Arabidopsis lyrata subsp. lyrata]